MFRFYATSKDYPRERARALCEARRTRLKRLHAKAFEPTSRCS